MEDTMNKWKAILFAILVTVVLFVTEVSAQGTSNEPDSMNGALAGQRYRVVISSLMDR